MRSTIKFAFYTSIACVLVLRTLTLAQHPCGMSIKIALNTFWKFSTAAGVTIIVVEAIGSPSKDIANEIASTVPPVGTAILAPKVTL
jgi:hypothetical protein